MGKLKITKSPYQHLLINNGIENFLEGCKNKTIASKDGEKIDTIEIESEYTLPFNIKYWLKRNTTKNKKNSEIYNELIEKISKSIKSKLKYDENKYSLDENYKKIIDDELKNKVQKAIDDSKDINEFKSLKNEEIEYFTIELSEKELEELEKEHNFLNYIPISLLDTIFIFKE